MVEQVPLGVFVNRKGFLDHNAIQEENVAQDGSLSKHFFSGR